MGTNTVLQAPWFDGQEAIRIIFALICHRSLVPRFGDLHYHVVLDVSREDHNDQFLASSLYRRPVMVTQIAEVNECSYGAKVQSSF